MSHVSVEEDIFARVIQRTKKGKGLTKMVSVSLRFRQMPLAPVARAK